MRITQHAIEPIAALQMVGNALNALAGEGSRVVRRRVAAMWIRRTVRALRDQRRPLSPAERARVAAVTVVLEEAVGRLKEE